MFWLGALAAVGLFYGFMAVYFYYGFQRMPL